MSNSDESWNKLAKNLAMQRITQLICHHASGIKYFDRIVPHVKRVENSVFSKWEQDYARYCLRTSLIQTST